MAAHRPSDPPPPNGRHVLIVDADGTTRAALRMALLDGGFLADTADTRASAMAALDQRSFELVAVDVSSPGLDGPGLIEEVRRLHPAVPVVAMTATHEDDAALEARMLGATSFINKPLDIRHVLTHFAAVLGV